MKSTDGSMGNEAIPSFRNLHLHQRTHLSWGNNWSELCCHSAHRGVAVDDYDHAASKMPGNRHQLFSMIYAPQVKYSTEHYYGDVFKSRFLSAKSAVLYVYQAI